MTAPLDGIKVLDLTRYQSGPACTVLLADLGADVIKVEGPGRGDPGRNVFPVPGEDINPYFLAMNRGKRGITVDYHSARGREVLHRLGGHCDVVAENFRPGAAEALGLGYEDFKRHNPKIVYASISAFGERGPMARQAGFDIHGQAVGGLMSTTGGEGGAFPVGAAIGDQMAGLTMVTGILSALLVRERQGTGQRVAVSLYSAQLALQTWEIGYHAMSGGTPAKAGHSHPIIHAAGVIWGSYPTSDGHIALGVLGETQWVNLLRVIGLPEEANKGSGMMRDASHLEDKIRERLSKQSTAHWLKTLQAEDIHVGRVNSYADILEDPQAWENDYLVRVRHPNGRSYNLVGCPIQYSQTPPDIGNAAPELGEHTGEVLGEFGYDEKEVEALRKAGVI
ncbi:MAG: CoA transferase [SAR324 cluster bacterium]|nr:CoA transferase [SAR324 cluster bacterium]